MLLQTFCKAYRAVITSAFSAALFEWMTTVRLLVHLPVHMYLSRVKKEIMVGQVATFSQNYSYEFELCMH